jgi:hypothetical protein
MKRPIALGAAALILFLAAGARLAGQSYRSFREDYDTILEQYKLRFGPVRLVPVFRLSEAGYDSNVYFADEGNGVVSDATATLSPEIRGYWLAGHSVILSVTENPEYLAYAREKALRAFSNSFSAGLRWLALGRFSLSADTHALSHVRRALSELDHRIRDSVKGATGALFFETARGTALGVTGGVDDFRYQDIAAGAPDDIYGRALDRRETSAAAELYYRVFSRSFVFSSFGYRRYDFSHAESAWRDGSSIEASGGFRFPIAGRARGTVRVGWKSFRPDSPDRKDFSGLVAATDIAFRMDRLGVTLGFDRDNSFSYIESAYYYVEARARAGLSLYLFHSLRIDGGIQYGTMSYPEPLEVWSGGVPVIIEHREDVQRNLSVGPVVRISGTVGLGMTYNFYRRTSNAPGFNIRRNFVGAFITYEF